MTKVSAVEINLSCRAEHEHGITSVNVHTLIDVRLLRRTVFDFCTALKRQPVFAARKVSMNLIAGGGHLHVTTNTEIADSTIIGEIERCDFLKELLDDAHKNSER